MLLVPPIKPAAHKPVAKVPAAKLPAEAIELVVSAVDVAIIRQKAPMLHRTNPHQQPIQPRLPKKSRMPKVSNHRCLQRSHNLRQLLGHKGKDLRAPRAHQVQRELDHPKGFKVSEDPVRFLMGFIVCNWLSMVR